MYRICFNNNKHRIIAITVTLLLLMVTSFSLTVAAHSGRTDSKGGHYDSSTGDYHYHHGYPAHQHINGKCPYLTISEPKNDGIIYYGRDSESMYMDNDLYRDILGYLTILPLTFLFLYLRCRFRRRLFYPSETNIDAFTYAQRRTLEGEIFSWIIYSVVFGYISVIITAILLLPLLLFNFSTNTLVILFPQKYIPVYISIVVALILIIIIKHNLFNKSKDRTVRKIVRVLDNTACYLINNYVTKANSTIHSLLADAYHPIYNYRITLFAAFTVPLLNYYLDKKIEKKPYLLKHAIKELEKSMGNVAIRDTKRYPFSMIADVFEAINFIKPYSVSINSGVNIKIPDVKNIQQYYIFRAFIDAKMIDKDVQNELLLFWEYIYTEMIKSTYKCVKDYKL